MDNIIGQKQSTSVKCTMNQEVYDHFANLVEAGEYIDFEIPVDAPSGKKEVSE